MVLTPDILISFELLLKKIELYFVPTILFLLFIHHVLPMMLNLFCAYFFIFLQCICVFHISLIHLCVHKAGI